MSDDFDLFGEAERLLSEKARLEFRTELTYLRSLKKDDELLRIAKAMGFLGLITQAVPMAIARQVRALKDVEATHLAALSTVQKLISLDAQYVVLACSQFRLILEEGVNRVDVERLAQEAHRKLSQAVLEPTEELVAKACACIGAIEIQLSKLKSVPDPAPKPRWFAIGWRPLLLAVAILVVPFLLCWVELDGWYHRALNAAVNQAQDRAVFDLDTLDVLNRAGREISIEPDGPRYLLVLPRADGAWISQSGQGVIEFSPQP